MPILGRKLRLVFAPKFQAPLKRLAEFVWD